MFRVSKVYFSPSRSVIASACFLLIGTNSLAVTQGAGSTNQVNAQYQQQQAAQQRQDQIRQQQLQMQQQLAQARQSEQARQQQVQMQQELAQKRQAEQARQEQIRQQQLQMQQQLAQARQAEQARVEQIRQQQLQMQQQLAQVRQQQALKAQQALPVQPYQATTGAGSNAQMSSQVQQKIDQQRQANQAATERARKEAASKLPTETATYKFIEKATPVVGAVRDTAAALTIGLAQQLITGEKSYIGASTINTMRSAELRAVEKNIENKAINSTIKSAPKPTPNFITPTNPPALPPATLPNGYTTRVMPPTEQYPNGYWKITDRGGNAVDPSIMKTPSKYSGPEFEARVHVPLPSKQ